MEQQGDRDSPSGGGDSLPGVLPSSSRRRGGPHKRKCITVSTASKRPVRDILATSLSSTHNRPSARTRQISDNLANSSILSSSDVNYHDVCVLPEESIVCATQRVNNIQDLEVGIEADYEFIRSHDTDIHVVPSHCGWFSWTKLHLIEKLSLPSFFDGQSGLRTPTIYKAIRDWILKKYHEKPKSVIELKDISELEIGDMNSRKEVFEFLDHWGLINSHLDADIYLNNKVSENGGMMLEGLFQFDDLKPCVSLIQKPSLATPAALSGVLPEHTNIEELVKPMGPTVEYHCNSCSTDCSRKRYHCQKQADYDLCSGCFGGGNFGSDMLSSDFILMESAESHSTCGDKWTDQETLLLLEAVELFPENWNEIAEHVATKTKAQCMLHFLQMPIEDTFFDLSNDTSPEIPHTCSTGDISRSDNSSDVVDVSNENDPKDEQINVSDRLTKSRVTIQTDDDKAEDKKHVSTALQNALTAITLFPSANNSYSIADTGNPVMVLAAFLGRLVESDLATASAICSLKSLCGDIPELQLAIRHSFILEDSAEGKSYQTDLNSSAGEADGGNQKSKQDAFKCTDSQGYQNDSKPDKSVHEDTVNPPEFCNNDSFVQGDNKNKQVHSHVDSLTDIDTSVSSVPLGNELLAEDKPSSSMEVLKHEDPTPYSSFPSESKQEAESDSVHHEASFPQSVKQLVPADEEVNKKDSSMGVRSNDQIGMIKRAALSALSAAAVKAKLLANEEEDQIRQLTLYLVEKQMHKLELKLDLFSEVENSIAGAREQLEKGKQRLYHERAQIIAARIGMSASISGNKVNVACPGTASL